METKIIQIIGVLMAIIFIAGCGPINPPIDLPIKVIDEEVSSELLKFESGEELVKAFEKARESGEIGGGHWLFSGSTRFMAVAESAAYDGSLNSAPQAKADFSETNVQIKGVDEADIIKTDGEYIYLFAKGKLIIVKAYPVENAQVLSETEFNDFSPTEMFIDEDRLLIFGRSDYNYELDDEPQVGMPVEKMATPSIMPHKRYMNLVTIKLYDISDKEKPELLRSVDFEGNYLTSRKIGDYAYFVINEYPNFYGDHPICDEIVPLYREDDKEFKQIAPCIDIGYIKPLNADNFITVASISMSDEDKDINKEVIVGNGQNVYSSLGNLYIAQTTYPHYNSVGKLVKNYVEKTVITKFNLDNGNIEFRSNGDVKGHILNQFSMDEYDSHFRIATTIGQVWDNNQKSTNNIYILDNDLEQVGAVEDLAPGERIYSVRFMGKRGYVVTFKKVDPLFFIDLEDHNNPSVLGKLKIPGYSDYLHPYDETHLIGIGKDTVEAEEDLVQRRDMDFAWYQGIKIAIFDVSDVENPIELHKEIIGDRGTDSEALHNHKAFLFDREKNLLILPITLAEIKGERSRDNQYGEYTFQGAYVYNLNLEDGFDLKGRVTHYDDDEVFKKSGYYFNGDAAIRRSMYINNVLYTLSDERLQLNSLRDLERLKAMDFN